MGANLELSKTQLKALGGEPFNMTVGALRLSRKANAVAQLHSITANKMWADVKDRAEIVGITNGIHLPTWVDSRILAAVDDRKALWDAHQKNKRKLIKFIKRRTGQKLDRHKLLIGFSRRAVPYKRANLIFSNEAIIRPFLETGDVQIVFSGKSHPLDDQGKELVAEIVEMSKKYPQAVVFLEDYDMEIGTHLTRGVDVWLNNPRRPKEASGTSGMKAAMNGVLNLSILDGWWPEACEHGVNGWEFGDAFESEDVAEQDANDRKALYEVLLESVIPTYYEKKHKWVTMMQASIDSTRELFGVKRMLEEYYEELYVI
jgi:starch phosphorylase